MVFTVTKGPFYKKSRFTTGASTGPTGINALAVKKCPGNITSQFTENRHNCNRGAESSLPCCIIFIRIGLSEIISK